VNANIAKALLRDALYQVLDNKVFRILVLLVLVLVGLTFLIGARPEELVILFGWRRIAYQDIFSFFGLAWPGLEDAHEGLIQVTQSLIVDNLAGTIGITIAIAGTAFFMPRMVEKGAADVVFSKPVSRLTLMLSRYVSGLLFISLLAVLLVGGMHLGFLVSSGYSDPGFLWSSLTLIYLFALLHAFSIAVGAITRSTVASILLTLLFLIFNSCVHTGWKLKTSYVESLAEPNSTGDADAGPRRRPSQDGPASESGSPAEATDPGEEMNALVRGIFVVLDVVHYVLPKTSDAALISQKLRRAVEDRAKALVDPEGRLEILIVPEGFHRQRGSDALGGEGALWTRDLGEGRAASVRITREEASGRRSDASAKLRVELEARSDVEKDVRVSREHYGSAVGDLFTWQETSPQGERMHRLFFFDGAGHRYRLEIEGPSAWMSDDAVLASEKDFLRSISFSHADDNPFANYEERFAWDAPLEYNMLFSIGSSLAFVAAMLALGWWRLARIDF
jgi:ABC-type transport system involved in multi-copper enzyme maturation permease subunit